MKKIFLAAAVMVTLTSTNAMADAIRIDGELIEEGCKIGDNDTSDITLSKITTKQLKEVAVGAELLNQSDSFKVSNCPNYEVRIQFDAAAPASYPDAIVNTDSPSGKYVAHYLRDARRVDHLSLTNPGSNSTWLTGDEAKAAQSAKGFIFPVLAGYTKIKDVPTGETPSGTTASTITLTITYNL